MLEVPLVGLPAPVGVSTRSANTPNHAVLQLPRIPAYKTRITASKARTVRLTHAHVFLIVPLVGLSCLLGAPPRGQCSLGSQAHCLYGPGAVEQPCTVKNTTRAAAGPPSTRLGITFHVVGRGAIMVHALTRL